MKRCSSGASDRTTQESLSPSIPSSFTEDIKSEPISQVQETCDYTHNLSASSVGVAYPPDYKSLSYFYIDSNEVISPECYLSANCVINPESDNVTLHPFLSNTKKVTQNYDAEITTRDGNPAHEQSTATTSIDKSIPHPNINELELNFDPHIHYINPDGDVVEYFDHHKLPPLSMTENAYSFKDERDDCSIANRRRFSQEPRTCQKCGRTFKYPSDLKKHEQIHTEVKKFTCQYCGRSFRRLHQLNVHVRIHTGEKPYVCRQCGMSFRHDSTLTMHTRTRHEHLKPFKCDVCKKMFGRLSHLRKHQRYVCPNVRKGSPSPEVCDESNLHPFYISDNLYFQGPSTTADKSELSVPSTMNQSDQCYTYDSENITHSVYQCRLCDMSFSSAFDHQQHITVFHPNTFIRSNPLNQAVSSSAIEFGATYNPVVSSCVSLNSEITSFNFSSIFDGQNAFLQDDYSQSDANLGFDVATQYINNNESKKSAAEIESLMKEKAYSVPPDFQ